MIEQVLRIKYIIAQNKSFAQLGIGVKYMDDLSRCPTNYCYTNAFRALQSIIQTINYITFYLKPLKIDPEASLFCTYISYILILYYFYIINLFLYCIFIIFYQNLEICLNPYFSQFFRQQVILPFFKNALKSILVRRYFGLFLSLLVLLYKCIILLLKIAKHQNCQYFAKISDNKLYGVMAKKRLKTILASHYFS